MERCLKENPSLNDKQKEAIKELMKISNEALKRIEVVGANIISIANLAGELPPQSPTGERN